MLKYDLIHPPLLEALATAGHGSQILIADGNFPYLTVRHPAARLVHLNVAPGLLTVTQTLSLMMGATNFEAGTIMGPDDESEVPIHAEFRGLLGPDVPLLRSTRWEFYDTVRSSDVGLVVATGDERLYANLLLTVGLR